jgi:protein-histidine pros-kinase
MTLRTKFNLILGFAGILGMAASATMARKFLENNARNEVLGSARMIMQSALAVRGYTTGEIRPLLNAQPGDAFRPQSVPSYSAHRYIAKLKDSYPEYDYKEATLNPTNPANRTTDWEADIVRYYRDNPDEEELSAERETPAGRFLYLSQPIVVNDPSCLACHDTPETAPAAMLAVYGPSNGFGWKMNEIIGAQIVSVPMKVPLERAHRAFHILLAALVGIFVLIGVLLNVLLHYVVIRPVREMAANANRVSMGEPAAGELAISGNDEISSLGHSFNRMHRSLSNAMKMLDDSES